MALTCRLRLVLPRTDSGGGHGVSMDRASRPCRSFHEVSAGVPPWQPAPHPFRKSESRAAGKSPVLDFFRLRRSKVRLLKRTPRRSAAERGCPAQCRPPRTAARYCWTVRCGWPAHCGAKILNEIRGVPTPSMHRTGRDAHCNSERKRRWYAHAGEDDGPSAGSTGPRLTDDRSKVRTGPPQDSGDPGTVETRL